MSADLKKINALSKLDALARADMQAQNKMLVATQPKVPTRAPPGAQVSPGLRGQGALQKKLPAARMLSEAPLGHWNLPAEEFTVVHSAVMVRTEPRLTSRPCGVKRRGDVVSAVEETFDGWLRILEPAGWMLQDMHGQGGVHNLLEGSGTAMLLLATQRTARLQHLTVVAENGAGILAEPVSSAQLLRTVKTGEVVRAESQTYHGWVRLQNCEGWIRSRSHAYDCNLNCWYLQESELLDVECTDTVPRPLPGNAIVPMSFALEVPPANWHLPTQAFKVTHGAVMVRLEPSFGAKACGVMRRQQTVHAIEETFDGWVRILEPEGWILRDLRGYAGVDLLLEPCGKPKLLTVSELADETGPQYFTVTADLAVLAEPVDDAEVMATLQPGDRLTVETQTYHGWLRLASGAGWVRGCSDEGKPFVICWYMKERTMKNIVNSQAEEKAKREADAEAALARELEHGAEIWDEIANASSSSSAPVPGESSGSILPQPKPLMCAWSDEETFASFYGLRDFNYAKLPECEFLVVREVAVRAEPMLSGGVCGHLVKGQVVGGWEETFDGWVHLSSHAGWALRHFVEEEDTGVSLQAIDPPEMLAVQEVSSGPARRMFEVVCEPVAYILKEPRSNAAITGTRACGEFVLAEAQTYHGWVRLADKLGWMQSSSHRDGQLLRSVTALEHSAPLLAITDAEKDEEEKRAEEEVRRRELEMKQKVEEDTRGEALRELEEAAASGDAAVFRAAIKVAKSKGVMKRDIARVNAAFSVSLS